MSFAQYLADGFGCVHKCPEMGLQQLDKTSLGAFEVGYFGNFLEFFGKVFSSFLRTFLEFFGNVLEFFWQLFWSFFETFLEFFLWKFL